MSDLNNAMLVSSRGMQVQTTRARVAAENIANAFSTSSVPGGDPYRRKTVETDNFVDPTAGRTAMVRVKKIAEDSGDFELKYDPGHPAANKDGYVKYPNVSTNLESMDLREARRTYEANLNALMTSRDMARSTLDILKQ
jgi:flagellar basal-body rod protein FlgC